MAQPLTYTAALRILGRDESTTLKLAEQLASGALNTLGVSHFAGLHDLVLTQGRTQLGKLREKISGVSRYDRTQRIAAAHQIVVTTAVFEALGELLADNSAPVSLAELEFSAAEQQHVVERLLTLGSDVDPWGLRGMREAAQQFHRTQFQLDPLRRFVGGLAAYERLDDTQRQQLRQLVDALPERAQRRYVESFRRLAAEVPEFGIWAGEAEHHATQRGVDQIQSGLARLEEQLSGMSAGNRATQQATELNALYRRALDRPVLRTVDAPAGCMVPTLGSAYLTPCVRFAQVTDAEPRPHLDDWWAAQSVEADFEQRLAAWLTQPLATERPMVVLGHPGAGKSKLTEILAARLPASDYLPIRVQLRSVPAEAPVRRQIEHALSETLHTDVSWRDLASGAGAALPVVLLDGLDELLQATGVNRSDYLEQVQAFQEDQATFGQPAAVLVTSRTLVTDRLRFPERTVIARLEAFDDTRITRLLELWSKANSPMLRERGLRPLPVETLFGYRELSEQPLLLLMLLLYDAADNALQREDAKLSRAQLYERLLVSFARREVTKHQPGLAEPELAAATEDEMRRLEVTALAMFARHRHSVTAEELSSDLTVLAPLPSTTPEAGLRQRLSAAEHMLGRFFFVHESQAQQDTERHVYEFLHATFGEYLVARLITTELDELRIEHAQAQQRRHTRVVDDGRFYAVTSFAVLASRTALVEFVTELLRTRLSQQPEVAGEYRGLLIELFREAPYPRSNRSHTEYAPRRVPLVARQAVHTANLIVLLTLVTDEASGLIGDRHPPHTEITELMPEDTSPREAWASEANLWRGCLAGDELYGLLNVVRVRHMGYGSSTTPRTLLQRERDEPVNVGECVGFEMIGERPSRGNEVPDPYAINLPGDEVTARLLRGIALRVNGTAARFALALLPYLRHVHSDPLRWIHEDVPLPKWVNDGSSAPPHPPERQQTTRAELAAQAVLELRLAPSHSRPSSTGS